MKHAPACPQCGSIDFKIRSPGPDSTSDILECQGFGCGKLLARSEIGGKGDETPDQVAQEIMKEMSLLTLSDTNEILVYVNGVYLTGAEALLASKIERVVDPCSNHFVLETLGHMRRRTYVARQEIDSQPNILNLKNGLLDLEIFEFREHTPDYYSVVQLPVIHDSNADCPRIKKFLSEVMYPEDIDVAQEFTGYCLWRRYEAQKALLLAGEGGNGKSTFISLIKGLLGIQNISRRSLQELEMNRFARADLYGRMANLYADLSDTALKSTGTFKMLTGGDPTTAEYKFRNGFSFVNYAKLIFSTNTIPEVYEDTTAFFRRWIILTFPNRFEGKKENKNLLTELTTPEELSGFLNWASEGLERLKSNNWKFSNSRSTEEVREEYIRKSSPIRAFLMDCTETRSDGYVVKQELFKTFAEYCRNRKLPAVTDQTFFRNLPLYVKAETTRKEVEGRRPMCYLGMALKSKDSWGKADNDDDPSDAKVEKTLDLVDTEPRKGAKDVKDVKDVKGSAPLSISNNIESQLIRSSVEFACRCGCYFFTEEDFKNHSKGCQFVNEVARKMETQDQ